MTVVVAKCATHVWWLSNGETVAAAMPGNSLVGRDQPVKVAVVCLTEQRVEQRHIVGRVVLPLLARAPDVAVAVAVAPRLKLAHLDLFVAVHHVHCPEEAAMQLHCPGPILVHILGCKWACVERSTVSFSKDHTLRPRWQGATGQGGRRGWGGASR